MINPTQLVGPTIIQEHNKNVTPAQAQQSFATMLNDAINQVNESQVASDKAIESLVNGEDVDLHNVMITAQKASITLQTTLEIRNKAVEAYQEIMRMQV
ncbi:flagellar hook-basal body complex protein FliE [Cytobacillus sp. IB215665]|uniref:flagellar hook-basal body complex protein FliE n=1 Tax=Cytobacillus sp. IB215665 TaxID=3097357 RepID=UPI002A0BAAF7|nr:flagellar hook-basal body complex protein FliE [Cytobacillus sp. IB215665]MDX8365060.1 flagellar hook-basal body complex protein FliE [Cytobacillus sp. IB215665]